MSHSFILALWVQGRAPTSHYNLSNYIIVQVGVTTALKCLAVITILMLVML